MSTAGSSRWGFAVGGPSDLAVDADRPSRCDTGGVASKGSACMQSGHGRYLSRVTSW